MNDAWGNVPPEPQLSVRSTLSPQTCRAAYPPQLRKRAQPNQYDEHTSSSMTEHSIERLLTWTAINEHDECGVLALRAQDVWRIR